MQVPLTVNAFPPVAIFPLAVIVPPTAKAAPSVVVVLEFTVKLFKPSVIDGSVRLDAAVKLELEPPVNEPLVLDIVLSVRVFAPIVRAPVVSVKVPFMVVLFPVPKLTPPLPFIVKLLMFPVNTALGRVMVLGLGLVNSTVALALLASIKPELLVIDDPEILSLYAPSVKFPLVRAKLVPIVKSLPRVTPPDPLSVKFLRLLLLKRLAGRVIPEVLVN